MNALPALLCSDEALMRLVGFKSDQVRYGVCQRGAAPRQGPRTKGPICADALADNVMKLNVSPIEAVFNGVIRALAKVGVFAAKLTGIVDATDPETTARYEAYGQVIRRRRITDKRGTAHEIEVTIYGWKLSIVIDTWTKLPLAAQVALIQEHVMLSLRAPLTQARTNLTGHARLHKVVFDKGFLDGRDLGRLDQHGITFVVPTKENMTMTVNARAQAAAGEGLTIDRRAHTVRHGQAKAACSERLETKVVGIAALTMYDQYGTVQHEHHKNRRDFQAKPINAAVVRKWHNRDVGPGGKTFFLTNVSGQQPLQPFDVDDDRSLIKNCCIKAVKQQWGLGHPPQTTGRAVRVHVMLTL